MCSGSTNRTCWYACNSGFSSSGSGSGIVCTCDSGKYIDANGNCVSCATCAAAPSNATLTQGGCSGSTNRTCSYACNSGFTTSGSGSSISCTCDSGKYIDANGACTPCPTGTYSSGTDATYCSQWAVCGTDYYVSTEPSATQNRGCTGCGSGFHAAGPNASYCTACASCSLDETQQGKVVSGCTAGYDGTCSCPPNTSYRSVFFLGNFSNPARFVYKCWCNAGYYETTKGYGSGCTSCPPGTYQTDIGKKSCITCGSCPSGYFRSGCGGSSSGGCSRDLLGGGGFGGGGVFV